MSMKLSTGKAAALAGALVLVSQLWIAQLAAQTVLWSEDFDSLTLEPNADEGVADSTAFTHTPPSGWTITNAPEMATGGVEEWRGWSFADPGFWSQVDGQRRGEFTRGRNVIAVADSDEFDDAANDVPPNGYSTFMATPAIDLSASNSNTLALQLDSSWRPEGTQTATITASFDGGAAAEILRFESGSASPFFKDDNSTNDSLTVFFDKPAGAASLQLEFGYFDNRNNWWWAVDNLQLLDGDPALRAVVDRDTGDITLFNRTGADQDIKGYSIESKAGALDPSSWDSVAGNLDADGDGTVDGDDRWVRFTDPATNTDISEGSLGTGTLAANTSLELGPTWLKYYQDEGDIRFRYIDGAGGVQEGIVEITGNGGNSYPFADLDFDNNVDGQDWQTFVAGVGGDVADATEAVRYRNSDLNGDGRYSPADVILFRNAYDEFNGAGAFAAGIVSVPEPSTAVLALLAGVVLVGVCRRRGMGSRVRSLLLALGVGATLSVAATASAQPFISVFHEDFDSLPLGPNVEEALAGEQVWTDVPPDGWNIDRSGVPGWNEPPDNNGVQEWIGWSFANRDWWVATAGDQNRSQFTRASGTVMVADPDEWDDATHPPSADNGWYNTTVTLSPIAVDGLPENSVSLSFDSSWRPEFDGDYHQSGAIEVSFDGGAPMEILRWLSDPASPDFKADATNEFLRLPVNNPAGATSMEITYRMFDAGNDWWWAVDNVDVAFEAEPLTLEVDTATGAARILASSTPGANFNITSYSITSPSGSLNPGSTGGGGPVEGDYNENGTVEQADLDLVLLNWGADLNAPWVTGTVDQAELDGVLLNWGNTGNGTGGGEGWLAGNLAAQGVDSIGSGIGESWEVLTASENQLFEAFLLGSTLFDGGHEESIGQAFNVAGQQDLEFVFSTVGGNEIQGDVAYVTSGLAGNPIPEPSSLAMLGVCLAAGGCVVWRPRLRTRMRTKPLGILLAFALLMAPAARLCADGLLIRHYPFENGTAGQSISSAPDVVTFGPENEDLAFGSNVTYASLTGGRTGLGASFSGSNSYLEGPALNDPADSESAAALNLTNIVDRGLQFWAFPSAAGMGSRQDLVMDTNQHGVYISPEDTWGFVYGGQEYDTGVPVAFGDWTHVQLNSLNSSGAALLYLNGEATASATGRYDAGLDISITNGWTLEVGSNAGFLGTFDPPPASENFYNGIIDDLKFTVYGSNGDLDHPLNFAVDNDAAAEMFTGVSAADVNLDGQVSGDGTGPAASDDVSAFVEGWMFRNVLPGGQLAGDVTSRTRGDLNFDGVTDIADWSILNLADPAAGAAAMSAISAAGVPEPTTFALAGIGLLGLWLVRRRRR